jgi:hypothetical protein
VFNRSSNAKLYAEIRGLLPYGNPLGLYVGENSRALHLSERSESSQSLPFLLASWRNPMWLARLIYRKKMVASTQARQHNLQTVDTIQRIEAAQFLPHSEAVSARLRSALDG